MSAHLEPLPPILLAKIDRYVAPEHRDQVAEDFMWYGHGREVAGILRAARAICIGCERDVTLRPPDARTPIWHHDDYPWRCDAGALHALATPEPQRGNQVMTRVDGRRFRCECGANVFTHRGDYYECNGCRARYVGLWKKEWKKEKT